MTALEIAQSIALEVAELTDINAHTDSLLVIARAFGFKGSELELTMIKMEQENKGHLPNRSYLQRRGVQKRILELIKEADEEAHQVIYGCL